MPESAHYLLLIVSLMLCVAGVLSLYRYKRQSIWVEQKAHIKRISEKEELVWISQYSRIKYFYPIAEYEYVVNGVKRLGSVASYEKQNIWVPEVNNWGDPIPENKRWWKALKPGDEVPVYVNPNNANESVLVRDLAKSRRSHHLALLVGGLVVGLLWLVIQGLTT